MHFNRDELKGLPFTFPSTIHRYINAFHSQTEGIGIRIIWCSFVPSGKYVKILLVSQMNYMCFGLALLLVSSLVIF
jgi:hypothetical protein